MARRISAREARAQFSEILGVVHFGKETVVVEKQGKPMVAVIPIDLYQRWMAEREGRFGILDDIRSRNRSRSEKEVSKDVTESVSEIRAAARLPRSRRAQGGR